MTGVTWSRTTGCKVVRERSGGVCEVCGLRPAQSASHRISRSRGGTWAPSNLLRVCGDGTPAGGGCHWWFEANPNYAGEGGWHIRRDRRSPAVIPVFLTIWLGWHLLDDEGGRRLVDPADYGLPLVPAHFPPAARPLHTTPWVDPR